MARVYARVKVTIWADHDFRQLTDQAQALYFRLLSSPTMSLCGVADWRPNRIAALTRGMTAEGVRLAAKELEEHSYILADDETEEVLVRTFVRHDGLIATPNIAAAMVKDYAGTASATLRGVIIHELRRLKDDEPEMKGWSVASKLLADPAIDPASENPSGNPSAKASGMASAIRSGEASGNGSHIPQPSSLNPQPLEVPSKKEEPRKRGARLPDSFVVTDAMAAWARENTPDVDLRRATAEFCDYWRAVAGAKGVKVDWIATWRNDMRHKQERAVPAPRANPGGRPKDQLAW